MQNLGKTTNNNDDVESQKSKESVPEQEKDKKLYFKKQSFYRSNMDVKLTL